MPEKITNEQIYEFLQKIQDNLAELRREGRYVKGEIISIHNIVLGKAMKTDLPRDD